MTVADDQDTAESRIRLAASTGELVDLHRSGEDHFLGAHQWAHGHAGHEIPAELIIELLMGSRPAGTPAPRAIRLCGAVITGSLNLEAATLASPLLLEQCQFTKPVVLDDVVAPKLSLRGCHVPGLSAKRLRTMGSLALDQEFTSTAGVDLKGARIGGQFLLNNARISQPPDLDAAIAAGTYMWALTADGITVEEGLLARGMTADGQVRLPLAHIKGELDMSGADIDGSATNMYANPDGIALHANHLTVGGYVRLGGANVRGQIYLRGASIGGQLVLDRARLASPGSSTLLARHMTVDQDMSCCEGFTSEGEISLSAARIGGHLTFDGATLSNPGHQALNAEWITVGKSVVCGDGFTADGEIRLSAAQLGGQLLFSAPA